MLQCDFITVSTLKFACFYTEVQSRATADCIGFGGARCGVCVQVQGQVT